jgi:LPXTG-site transpeptidase (sortase) family protein
LVKRPRPALVVLVVSAAVIIVSLGLILVLAFQARQSADISSVGSRDLASLSSQESASTSPEASPTPAASPPVTASPTAGLAGSPSASPSVAVSKPLTAPVRVRIPRIDVNATVLPVGLDKTKALAIPADITKVGWYELGVPPGAEQGSAVLVAHRDGRVQGHGVFYDLGQLSVGDKVAVTTSSGDVLRYKVVSRELISKKRLPLEELFAVDGPARLTLISCGGYYDRNNGGYQDNIVVTAIPLGAA